MATVLPVYLLTAHLSRRVIFGHVAAVLALAGTLRAFGSPDGLKSVAAMNAPDGRRASLPGFGGIGTAAALAKYAKPGTVKAT